MFLPLSSLPFKPTLLVIAVAFQAMNFAPSQGQRYIPCNTIAWLIKLNNVKFALAAFSNISFRLIVLYGRTDWQPLVLPFAQPVSRLLSHTTLRMVRQQGSALLLLKLCPAKLWGSHSPPARTGSKNGPQRPFFLGRVRSVLMAVVTEDFAGYYLALAWEQLSLGFPSRSIRPLTVYFLKSLRLTNHSTMISL